MTIQKPWWDSIALRLLADAAQLEPTGCALPHPSSPNLPRLRRCDLYAVLLQHGGGTALANLLSISNGMSLTRARVERHIPTKVC